MTDREALREAQDRFGEQAAAWHPAYTRKGEYLHCAVGVMVGETREDWTVYGRGATWEKAFADAAARGH